jgi:AraC-like DNA-binding protein
VGSSTNATSLPPDLPRPATGSAVGLLRPAEAGRYLSLERLAPPEDLATWVEHLWTVTWALPPGATYRSQVLTHPAVHLAVEWGDQPHRGIAMPASLLHGVVTRTFDIDLAGTGGVVGVRFRPGGFGAFTGSAVAQWTDRVVALRSVFGPAADELTTSVLVERSLAGQAERMHAFLARRIPDRVDRAYDELLGVVSVVLHDRSITTVAAMTAATGVSARTLQRLFRRYVGVGPKWVLQRFRLHDAVASIDAGEVEDLAALAVELGWYDQSHFSRDFADVVGVPPGRYLAEAREAQAQPEDADGR